MRSHGNLIWSLWRWRCHGVLTAISRQPWRFYKAPWRSYGVLVGHCLRSRCAVTTLPLRASSCHGARTACARCIHAAPTALTAFCLHSEVVEITSRVLISQVRHEPMLPVSDHASKTSAFVQPCLKPKVTTHWCPPLSSSTEPTYKQACSNPAWWCTSVMALNISKTKVMYISSRHMLALVQMKTFLK